MKQGDDFVILVCGIDLDRHRLFIEHDFNRAGCSDRISCGCRFGARHPRINPFRHLAVDQKGVPSIPQVTARTIKGDVGTGFFGSVRQGVQPGIVGRPLYIYIFTTL